MKYKIELGKNEQGALMLEFYGSPADKAEAGNFLIDVIEELTLHILNNSPFMFVIPNEDVELDIEVSEPLEGAEGQMNVKIEGVDFTGDNSSVSALIMALHNSVTHIEANGLDADSLFIDIQAMS